MNICVVGGGASGLVAAIIAAENNNNVRILEFRDRVGHKILATGNGKCNLTNKDMSSDYYFGLLSEELSGKFVDSVYKRVAPSEVIDLFERIGLIVSYKRGTYGYPASLQASSVLDVLRFKLESLGVEIVCNCNVTEIKKNDDGFIISSSKGKYKADRVIMSCGSKASLKSDAYSGLSLSKALGHNIIEPVPALVPIICSDDKFKQLAGIRVESTVALMDQNEQTIAKDHGELQLTSYGLSGIVTMNLSFWVSKLINQGEKLHFDIDLFPEMTEEQLTLRLNDKIESCPYLLAESFLIGIVNKNLALAIIRECRIDRTKKIVNLSKSDINNIVNSIKHFHADVAGTKKIEDAQICAGGVDVTDLADNMESKIVPGLFYTGEMIDVNGKCGGYNLHWAFATGICAGKNCSLISKG